MNGKVIIIFLICILVNSISFSQVCEIDSISYTHVDCYGSSTGLLVLHYYNLIVFIKKPIGGLVLMDFMQTKH